MEKKRLTYKEHEEVFALICKMTGYESVKETASKVRKAMQECKPPVIKKHSYMFDTCYFYVQPITKETKVQEGILLRRYTRHGVEYYKFLGEDGLIHNDDDDCVMGNSREKIETYLNEIRDDMIAGGDIL